VPGSGVVEPPPPPPPPGTPGTLLFAVVPNEKLAAVIVVAAVTPVTAKLNVAVLEMNGLWAGFPAIEEFAFGYEVWPAARPIIVSDPPEPASESRWIVLPVPVHVLLVVVTAEHAVKVHGTALVPSLVIAPLDATEIRLTPEGVTLEPGRVNEFPSVKKKSLSSWPALNMLVVRSVKTTLTVPAPVVTVAEALTGSPTVSTAAAAVVKVMVLADKEHTPAAPIRLVKSNLCNIVLFPPDAILNSIQ
jgi:hypothetical protein